VTKKKTTIQLPNICLIGAPGSGKRTVAQMLKDLAGYRECPRSGDTRKDGVRSVVIENGYTRVQTLKEHGYVVVYVYAPPTTRSTRLQLTGEPMGDDHGPTGLLDHSVTNIDGLDDLRVEVAHLLSGLQS
jgi:cytidylate kinase